MGGVMKNAELARRLEVAHENVATAEAELERALRELESHERADKRLISAALRDAFQRVTTTRLELESALATVR
jgi:hypothetical protein